MGVGRGRAEEGVSVGFRDGLSVSRSKLRSSVSRCKGLRAPPPEGAGPFHVWLFGMVGRVGRVDWGCLQLYQIIPSYCGL